MIQNFISCFQRQFLTLNNDKTRLCSYYQMLLSAFSFDFLCLRGAWQKFHCGACRGHQDGAGMRTRMQVAGDGGDHEPSPTMGHLEELLQDSAAEIIFSWWRLNPFRFSIKCICLPHHQLPNGFESCFLSLKFLPWFCSWVSSNPASLVKAAAASPLLQITLRTMIFSTWLITYAIIFHSENGNSHSSAS